MAKKSHTRSFSFADLGEMSAGTKDLAAGAALGVLGIAGLNFALSKLPATVKLPDFVKKIKPALGGAVGVGIGYLIGDRVGKFDKQGLMLGAGLAGVILQVAKLASEWKPEYFALNDYVQLQLDGYGNVIVDDNQLPQYNGLVVDDSSLNGMNNLAAIAIDDSE